MNNEKAPALFISHGSPMLAIEESETAEFLRNLGQRFEKPKAIVVFSAHLDRTNDVAITASAQPGLIYDFYGFPEPLYQLRYNAPGQPELAKRVSNIYAQNGISATLDEHLGLDHGVWMPLYLMYPNADIPVVQISINSQLGAEKNHALGQLLAPLRDEGVMIIGSGGISHNLREVFAASSGSESRLKVDAFTSWVDSKLQNCELKMLFDYYNQAPYPLFNHPTPEHFLPLFCALGTSDLSQVTRIHSAVQYEVLAMDAYQFS